MEASVKYDGDLVKGCLALRYAKFRARLSSEGVQVAFWAAADGESILLGSVERGSGDARNGPGAGAELENRDEEGLPAHAFNADIGENLRLGMVYDSVGKLCDALLARFAGEESPASPSSASRTSRGRQFQVLELGAGMGLPGLFTALRFPSITKVTLTDRHPGVLELLRRNVGLNFASPGPPGSAESTGPDDEGVSRLAVGPDVEELDWDPRTWGAASHGWLLGDGASGGGRRFDYVIAADVLYIEGAAPLFFGAAAAALKRPGGILLLAHKTRSQHCHLMNEILPAAADHGLELVAGVPRAEDGIVEVLEFRCPSAADS